MKDFGAESETSPLKKVLVYRPGDEIKQIRNAKKWLFLDIPNLKKMQEQHYNFTTAMKIEGIEVINVETKETRDIPNLYFTRDYGFTLNRGFFSANMNKVRKKEELSALNMIKKAKIPIISEKLTTQIEGGDIIFLNSEIMLMGYSKRTDLASIFNITKYTSKNIIPIELQKNFIHLDVVFNCISEDQCLIYKPALKKEFLSFLKTLKFEIIEVQEKEQKTMGTNV